MRTHSCLGGVFAAILLVLTIGSAAAHHSYIPKYNPAKFIKLNGVITSVNYQNPHIFFTIEVRTRSGQAVEWTVETESISLASKQGLTQAKMPVGSRVTITGWQSRSGGAEIGLSTYRLRNGRTLTVRRTPR